MLFGSSGARRFGVLPALSRADDGAGDAVDKVSRSVPPVTDFYVSAELYRLNKHLDGDGDGIACES